VVKGYLAAHQSFCLCRCHTHLLLAVPQNGFRLALLPPLLKSVRERELQQARPWQIGLHHQVLLGHIFATMSYLQHSIQHLQLEIEQRLCPFEKAMQLRLAYSWHGGRLPLLLCWLKLA
jgi:hypothetical protein